MPSQYSFQLLWTCLYSMYYIQGKVPGYPWKFFYLPECPWKFQIYQTTPTSKKVHLYLKGKTRIPKPSLCRAVDQRSNSRVDAQEGLTCIKLCTRFSYSSVFTHSPFYSLMIIIIIDTHHVGFMHTYINIFVPSRL